MTQSPQRCLIYLIRNTLNAKVYIGQTWTTTERRWKAGYHRQPHLWNAIQLYGRHSFYYEELLCCQTQNDADYYEKYFINLHRSSDRKFGYNIREGGSNGRMSDATKKKISASKKGKPGRKQSIETREKISQSSMGRIVSEATKKKIGNANRGASSPNFGTHLSKERRKLISEAVSGEKHPLFGKEHTDQSKKMMQMNCRTRKIGPKEVLEIRKYTADGTYTQRELSAMYNVSPQNINDIVKRRSWKNI